MKNYAAEAFASLSRADQIFLRSLPKAELHAHLNGCIPISCLQDLARQRVQQQHQGNSSVEEDDKIARGLAVLEQGVVLEEIHDFFDLFPAIYALTSTPAALRQATRAVLEQFLQQQPAKLGGVEMMEPAQCVYIELRTTPRENAHMSREQYLDAVLCEMEAYTEGKCALIVSIDRRMDEGTMMDCVRIAAKLKNDGRRVVGIDLCGTPTVRLSVRLGRKGHDLTIRVPRLGTRTIFSPLLNSLRNPD
jgi:adenosine deaminase